MLQKVIKYLPPGLAYLLKEYTHLPQEELRLRANQPAMLYGEGQEYILSYRMTGREIEDVLSALCGHSPHAYMEEMRQGYFTVEGGVRVGVAGRVVQEGGRIKLIRGFTSLNLRFPRELRGIGKQIYPYISENGVLRSTLILSPPQFGKTTLLRDIVRSVSSGEQFLPQKCVVVDERAEIAGDDRAFDLGPRTDILSLCPKSSGMYLAMRSLSPEVLATDEVGSEEDLAAIFEAVNSGVTVLATAHARTAAELKNKFFFRELLEARVFERLVFLSGEKGRGTVDKVLDARLIPILERPFRLVAQEVAYAV